MKEKIRQREKIIAIITNKKGGKKRMEVKSKEYNIFGIVRDKLGKIKQIVNANNIVTNDGDEYFAERGAGETPTVTFINCVLGTGSIAAAKIDDYDDVTPITGSNSAPEATYPMSNDQDADNTGKAVDSVTWKYYWTGADFNNAAIREGCITIASPIAGSKVLTRWVWVAAFEKTATDTLTLYVNENMLGV